MWDLRDTCSLYGRDQYLIEATRGRESVLYLGYLYYYLKNHSNLEWWWYG